MLYKIGIGMLATLMLFLVGFLIWGIYLIFTTSLAVGIGIVIGILWLVIGLILVKK